MEMQTSVLLLAKPQGEQEGRGIGVCYATTAHGLGRGDYYYSVTTQLLKGPSFGEQLPVTSQNAPGRPEAQTPTLPCKHCAGSQGLHHLSYEKEGLK